jgi:segregation and condensation protein B
VNSEIPTDLAYVIEGLLFASGRILTASEIASAYEKVTRALLPTEGEVEEAVNRLNNKLEESGSALRVARWGGGFRMATESAVAPFINAVFEQPPRRLTKSLMETLAVIAYRQPVTKPEVDFVRGVDSTYAVRKLMEMDFVALVGRSDTVGRPLVFGTTPRFLEEFGLNALSDLPELKETEELLEGLQLPSEQAQLVLSEDELATSDNPDGPDDSDDEAASDE